jgi:SWIM zinc finger
MNGLSRERVLALAPDPAAAKAGEGQAIRVRWTGLGHDEGAVWGECKGSGATPYRCQATLADGAVRCSCPSRKVPCKHALGLLLLLAAGEIPAASVPDWVADWLTARVARAAKAASTGDAGSGPADPEGQRRRAASREQKVDGGVEELHRWLTDLARGGLAAAQAQSWLWWDQVARRMIDAQARGLAGYVRRLAEIAAAGSHRPDWPERMLDQLGALHLLCEAWTRRDELPPETAAAMRSRIGFTTPASEVLESGRRITDSWAVLGQRSSDDGQLVTLQQWLYGERTGAVLTYLAFAAGGGAPEPGLPLGVRTEATVALYPGNLPPRALIAHQQADGDPLGPMPGPASWTEALSGVPLVLSADPWADIIPLAVRGLTVLPAAGPGSPWLLRDATGRAVPVAAGPDVRWRLLALSGGRPVDVAGEWDGFGFNPQAAAPAGQIAQLLT